jgi:hypothetical protein
MADIKKIVLTIAVGVLFALFVGFLVDAVYPSPEYNDFCKPENRPVYEKFPYPASVNTSCPSINYNDPIYSSCTSDKGYVAYKLDNSGCQVDPYCDTCSVEFDKASKKYSRNLFFILAPVSILAIILGMFLLLESIGSGFILGGILVLIYATIRVFGDLSKVMRAILLGVELALVIWLGYKRIEKGSVKKKK